MPLRCSLVRRAIDDWFTVVDARGRFTWLVGLGLAAVVSVVEILGAAIVAAVLQLATATDGSMDLPIVGDLEERLPGSDRASDLRWLAAAGAVFFIVRGLAVIGQQYVTFRSTFSLAARLADQVTQRLLARPYLWHLGVNSSDIATQAVIVTQSFAIGVFAPVQAVGSQLCVILALSAVAIIVEPIGALGSVAVIGVVVGLILKSTRRRLTGLGQVEIDETLLAQRLVSEAFQGVREVKVLGIGSTVRARLWASRQRWSCALRTRATLVAAPRSAIETVAFCALLALLAYRGAGGADTLAGIGVLGYALIRILPTANNVLTHLNTARGAQASMHQLADLLREADQPGDEQPERSAVTPGTTPPTLVVSDVSFSYPDGTAVLRGVDLEVRPGASVGLVGPTGCGKSTLLDVMIGLLPVSSGTLTLGGKPLTEDISNWWSQIGVVPQHSTLLDASLAENVALGLERDRIDERALERALTLAALTHVVRELPMGADTTLGERGVRLSGGQRQRVAIARALYRDPPVIFLDEGTSALDGATEKAVIDGLRRDRPDRTLIMVAHRISTLRGCDEILVLDAGRVVARGTHDELLRSSELFRRLASVTGAP